MYICNYVSPAESIITIKSYTGNSAVQRQKAVSAYIVSKQILPFGFADQNYYVRVSTEKKILVKAVPGNNPLQNVYAMYLSA